MTPKQEKFAKEQIAGQLENVQRDLAVYDEATTPRMPERVFHFIWLPFFAGDKELPYKVAINPHWVNFAGSLYQKVHVVDERNQVLFTVPPIFDRESVKSIVQSTGKTIGEVIKEAELLSGLHPAQGAAHMERELEKRALIMQVPPTVMENLKIWNAIFERYGRPPIAPTPADKGSSAAASGAADLDYDYDPL